MNRLTCCCQRMAVVHYHLNVTQMILGAGSVAGNSWDHAVVGKLPHIPPVWVMGLAGNVKGFVGRVLVLDLALELRQELEQELELELGLEREELEHRDTVVNLSENLESSLFASTSSSKIKLGS